MMEYQCGDWVSHEGAAKSISVVWHDRHVSLYCPNKNWGSIYADKYNIEDVLPILVTPEILSRNGWERKSGIWALKSTPRLGWKEDGTFVLGWTELPQKVKYIHELQHVFRLCGISKEIKL